jgi:hypothetical protein
MATNAAIDLYEARMEGARQSIEGAMDAMQHTEIPETMPGAWLLLCVAQDHLAGACDDSYPLDSDQRG